MRQDKARKALRFEKGSRGMDVSIYSREAVTRLLCGDTFPKSAAAVRSYDPPNGKWKSLGKDDYFTEADEVALFILRLCITVWTCSVNASMGKAGAWHAWRQSGSISTVMG